MKEIEGSKWNFNIQRKSSMGQGKEDSSFAPFINTRIRCLVREYIQNSFDDTLKMMKNLCVLNLNFVNFLVLITLN